MPRRTRMYVGGVPYHVVHRGNNRQACFHDTEDRLQYLGYLADALDRHDVALHAFVLMTNHVHLLMTPQSGEGISLVMKVTASRFAHFANRKYARTGTLWEGRHKAGAIEQDAHLLCCFRYIEMNPVRAGIVASPGDYRWSSHRANALGETVEWLASHSIMESLGSTPDRRQAAYRALFDTSDIEEANQSIRDATEACLPVGSAPFIDAISRQAGQPAGHMRRGRPRRAASG